MYKSRISEMLSATWAMREEDLQAMISAAVANPKAFFHTFPEELADRHYEVDGGVAIIKVRGSLANFSWWPESSYEAVRQELGRAMEDPDVKAILLDIDSPGGTVSGLKPLVDWIAANSGEKPMCAFSNETMCSAAFWLGAATGHVYAASPLSWVGSIGVYSVHLDLSKWNEENGFNFTWIHAGDYKVLGNPDEPLDDKALSYLEGFCRQQYDVFCGDVSASLALDLEDRKEWADGRAFLASDGVKVGLVGQIISREQLILSIQEDTMDKATALAQANAHDLRAYASDAVREIVEGVEKEAKATLDKAKEDAAKAQNEAVTEATGKALGMIGLALGSEAETKVKALLDTGVTVEQAKAFGIGQEEATNPESDADADKAEGVKLGASGAAALKAIREATPKGVQSNGSSAKQQDPNPLATLVMKKYGNKE